MRQEYSLNAKQKEAIETLEGPVLVIAGAGAGKTKVITERIKNLIASGLDPSSILAVTFTNKAAGEMRNRLNAAADLFIGTFHALGLLIIKENVIRLGISKNFSILDEDDAIKLVKECIVALSLNPKEFDPGRIKNNISRLKNKLMTPEKFIADGFFAEKLEKIWAAYEVEKQKQHFLDFDDLLIKPVLLFQNEKNTLEKYQNKWKYIHIDEYQDTNEVQYMLVKMLAEKYKNIMVVGDIDQAIYSWRGADFRNVLNFQRDYPGAKVITLEENYRSTDIILEAANFLISNNRARLPKNLWTKNKGREQIKVIFSEDERKEAEIVAKEVAYLSQTVPLKNMAMLYRTNAQSRSLEEALLQHGIPYKIIGGVRFYERREVKDILAYLRLIQNQNDTISKKRILNVPPRGIGKAASLKILGNFSNITRAEKQKKEEFELLIQGLKQDSLELGTHECIKKLIKKIGYRAYIDDGTEKGMERWQNIEELLGVAKKLNGGLSEFLEHVALFSVDDRYDAFGENRVSLMTIHTAKGLEFEAVFVVGLEEGLFPHALSISSDDVEEERRLCYVAVTRAKSHLYLTLAGRRTIFGERIANTPSRFLKEIPENLLMFINKPEEIEENIIIE